jgi:NlpC/P60 family
VGRSVAARRFGWHNFYSTFDRARHLAGRRGVAAGLVALLCIAPVVDVYAAQSEKRSQEPVHEDARPRLQLLAAEDGRAIVDIARGHEPESRRTQDCSHLVHEIYARAGFSYPYLSSFDLYSGGENFERVKNPQAGDVIVWPGHVGIVADPKEHVFYSLVRSGIDSSNYESAYWKARGKARFFRYVVSGRETAVASLRNGERRAGSVRSAGAGSTSSADRKNAIAQGSTREASQRTAVYDDGDRAGANTSESGATAAAVPRSIVIAEGRKVPTREEAAAGISELSNASGSELRGDAARYATPVVVFDQLQVSRLELKRDRGWAFVQIEERASLWGDDADLAKRSETVRWELRRGKSGWEAVLPYDRTYVPRDVAVRNIAARLSRLTQQGAASDESNRREEERLTRLLSSLLEDSTN